MSITPLPDNPNVAALPHNRCLLRKRSGPAAAVPDLTSIAAIKLNERILLLSIVERIALQDTGRLSDPAQHGAAIWRSRVGLAHIATLHRARPRTTMFGNGSMFTTINPAPTRRSKPAGAEIWHLWTVILPRRSITGRLVRGRVWRRRDGRRWQYKQFIEYDEDRE